MIKEIKIGMDLINYDKEMSIEKNEVYYAKDFNKKDLMKLKGKIKIIEIDCKKCQDTKSLWQEYADKKLLPPYFGKNWDAFYDSISEFEFFEEYDLVVFLLNDFEFFMKENLIEGVSVYKVIKESIAFKIVQGDDNKPPLTYIFNRTSSKRGLIDEIRWIYNDMEMKVEVPVYDETENV